MPPRLSEYEEGVLYKCASRWVRSVYEQNNLGPVESLEELFSIGVEIYRLTSVCSQKTLSFSDISLVQALVAEAHASTSHMQKSPLNHFNRMRAATATPNSISPNHDAIAKSLYHLRTNENMALKGVTANDLADGNKGTAVKLAWSMFSHFQLRQLEGGPEAGRRSGQKDILMAYLRGLESRFGLKVRNIRALQDGVTLCALVAHLAPDVLDFSTISRDNRAQNMRTAYTALVNDLEVPALLDFSDLIDSKTNERALIFFVGHAIHVIQHSRASTTMSSQNNDTELTHIKSKVQIMEKKMEGLTSTAQRLSAGFSMVVSSSESLEENTFLSQRSREAKLARQVSELETKVKDLTSIAQAQNSKMEELLTHLESVENLMSSELPQEEDILQMSDVVLRAEFQRLAKQNRILQACNNKLVYENEALRNCSSSPPSSTPRSRSPSEASTDSPDLEAPLSARKKRGTLKRKTTNNFSRALSNTLDKFKHEPTESPRRADTLSPKGHSRAYSHSLGGDMFTAPPVTPPQDDASSSGSAVPPLIKMGSHSNVNSVRKEFRSRSHRHSSDLEAPSSSERRKRIKRKRNSTTVVESAGTTNNLVSGGSVPTFSFDDDAEVASPLASRESSKSSLLDEPSVRMQVTLLDEVITPPPSDKSEKSEKSDKSEAETWDALDAVLSEYA